MQHMDLKQMSDEWLAYCQKSGLHIIVFGIPTLLVTLGVLSLLAVGLPTWIIRHL